MTANQVIRLLEKYRDSLVDAKRKNAELALDGLKVYSESELDASIKILYSHIDAIDKHGLSEERLDDISDDLDEERLVRVSWENALNRANGEVVKSFDACDKVRGKLIDLIQG